MYLENAIIYNSICFTESANTKIFTFLITSKI